MTNEEIKKELSKIPEEDRDKIKVVESLSDDQLTDMSGGLKNPLQNLSPQTQTILKYAAKAGCVITLIAGTWYISNKKGYQKGLAEGIKKGNDEGYGKGFGEGQRQGINIGRHIGYGAGYNARQEETNPIHPNTADGEWDLSSYGTH